MNEDPFAGRLLITVLTGTEEDIISWVNNFHDKDNNNKNIKNYIILPKFL